MANAASIQRVKGTNDVLMSDYHQRQTIQNKLLQHFARYGYATVETPILEHSELYLRKSGEEIVARMYDFEYQNRRLCLRPEVTASAMRAYIDNLQDAPLPVRLSYAGAVFRYERPQFARYRQFTQVGVELIGAQTLSNDNADSIGYSQPEVLADAEIIGMAALGLEHIGIQNYQLVIGSVALLFAYFKQLGVQGQMQNVLLLNMENLRKEGVQSVVKKIQDVNPAFVYDPKLADIHPTVPTHENRPTRLTDMLKQMNEDEARNAVSDFLGSLNITIQSTRNENEIIDRLLGKLKQEDDIPKLNQALTFMQALGDLRGNPREVLEKGYALLAQYHLNPSVLRGLEQVLAHVIAYGIDESKIQLDLGLSRGLQYYTGTVFEIHHGELGDSGQLCGGGRYNDLVRVLGGRDGVDSTGFSYGLERLVFALDAEQSQRDTQPETDVFLTAIDATDTAYLIRVATVMRNAGVRVEIAVRERSLRSHLQYASKRQIPLVIIVGESEREAEQVVIRDMNEHTEQTLPLADLVAYLNERSA